MSDFNEIWILFYFIFSKITKISNFTKILPEGVKLLHADGRTDERKTNKQT